MSSLSQKIKILRKKNGYSMRKLGSMCGISPAQINDIEHGKSKNPTLRVLKGLAKSFDITITQLTGY